MGNIYTNEILAQDKAQDYISGIVRTKPVYKAPSFAYPGEACTFTLETKEGLKIIKGIPRGAEICSSIKEGDTLVIKPNKGYINLWDKNSTLISLEDIVSINSKKFK